MAFVLKDLVLSTEKDKELYNRTAEEIAKLFVAKDKWNKPMGVSRHQLRRQYENVIKYKQALSMAEHNKSLESEWNKKLPLIKMIRSQNAYAVARANQTSKYTTNQYNAMKEFIDVCINQIVNYEQFLIFCNLFEAVYGFYYELGGSQI